MAGNTATIELDVNLDEKNTVARLKGIGTAGDRAAKQVHDGFSRAGRSLGDFDRQAGLISGRLKMLAGAAGLGYLAKNAVDVASSFENMEMKLDVLSKGKGEETLEKLNQWALDMPVNTRQAVDSFVQMNAMGLDPSVAKLQILTEAGVVLGDDVLPRLSLALGQMSTLGRVHAQDLNQMAQAGVNARRYLNEAFGMSVEEIQKAGIEIDKVIGAIMDGLEREFKGSAKLAMNTWSGLTITLGSYWDEFNRRVMEAGVFDYLKNEVKNINTHFSKWLRLNDEMLRQEVPEYVESIKTAISGTYSFISSNPTLFEYGILGLMIGGKKGALILGALGYASDLIGNIDKSIQLYQSGLISLSDISKSFYSNTALQELIGEHEIALKRKQLEDQVKLAKKYIGWNGEHDQALIDEAQEKLELFDARVKEIQDKILMEREKELLEAAARQARFRKDLEHIDAPQRPQRPQRPQPKPPKNYTPERIRNENRAADRANHQADLEYKEFERQRRAENVRLQMISEYNNQRLNMDREAFAEFAKNQRDLTANQKKEYNEMLNLGKTFAQSLSQSMNSYFFDVFMGRTRDIGEALQTVLAQVGAQLASTSLMYGLFGKNFTTEGKIEGVVGAAMNSVSDGRKRSRETTINVYGTSQNVAVKENNQSGIDIVFDQVDQYIASGIQTGNTKTAMALQKTYRVARSGL